MIRRAILTVLIVSLCCWMAGTAQAQVIQPPYNVNYSLTDLGSVPGLPPLYGGLKFLSGDPNTLLIGGNANTASGQIYEITVVRDGLNHVTGFSGTAAVYSEGAYNDGGVDYGPANVLFLARWPVNEIGQVKWGSAVTDKIVDLDPLSVVASPGSLTFVPSGFPGAGTLKICSWSGGEWYELDFSPDGAGTYDITTANYRTTIVGGPEGFIYVPLGSPDFPTASILVSEYSAGSVAAYEVDANGDPTPLTRQTFISGLTGAEGATIDPLTGDFLFSTFGGGDRVIVVEGFAAPPPTPTLPVPTPTSPAPTPSPPTPIPTPTSPAPTPSPPTPTPAVASIWFDNAVIQPGTEARVSGTVPVANVGYCGCLVPNGVFTIGALFDSSTCLQATTINPVGTVFSNESLGLPPAEGTYDGLLLDGSCSGGPQLILAGDDVGSGFGLRVAGAAIPTLGGSGLAFFACVLIVAGVVVLWRRLGS